MGDAVLGLAAPDESVRAFGIGSGRFGDIGVLASRELPIVEFNRALCIGLAMPATGAALDEAAAWLQANAAAGWALQIGPAALTDIVRDWLEGQAVRLVEDAQAAEAFGLVVQAGFGLREATATWFAALFGRQGWRLYLAYDGETPIASGAAFAQQDGLAWLGIDATLAEYRRRGAQSALIARRVEDGRAAGLAGFTAETGQPPPGQEAAHTSYSNYRRAGFTPAYARLNYKLP
jgi:hypothetical protein